MQSDFKKLMRARGNALLGNLAVAVALIGLLAAGARAQGVRYDNIVLGPSGRPVSSAQIAVCTAAAVRTTTPCSPLAQVYSDQALTQPMANPFTSDSLGNYGFWAEPGHYVVQIYGTGVTMRTMDVFLACDPSNCSMTSATVSSITAGTLNLTGSLSVDGRNVATEPLPSDSVEYVSPNGNDSNDGLSWGTAKQSLYAAVNSLENAKGGTVYVAAGSSCGGPVSGQGLWLLGEGDPNYNSPPAGWIKVTSSLQVIGVGVGSTNGSGVQNGPEPVVTVNCGSSGNNPSLWISGTGTFTFLKFKNLSFASAANNAVRLGIGSDGSRTDTVENEVTFDGDDFSVPNNGTAGPTVDIGANTFWIWFRNCGINADNSATPLSDAHQAVVVDPTASGPNASGLIFFNNLLTDAGGIHFYGNAKNNPGSLYVNDYTFENGNDGSPAVWITPTTGNGAGGSYYAKNVLVSDATVSPTCGVKVDVSNASPSITVVSDIQGAGQDVCGPMNLAGGDYSGAPINSSPLTNEQFGFWNNRLWGPSNNGNFRFGMGEIPFSNLIPENPTSWADNGTGAALTPALSPDGTDDAWETTASPTGGIYFLSSVTTFSVGDYIIYSSWIKAPSGYNGYNNGIGLTFVSGGCTFDNVYSSGPNYAGSNWQFYTNVARITTGGSCNVRFIWPQGNVYHQTAFFEPTYLYVPASDGLTDDDAIGIAMELEGVPNGVSPGTVSTWAGHPIAFGGSGDSHFATLDHTGLTANQTYDFPNQSGTVALVLSGTTGSIGGSALAAGACTTGTASIAGSTTSMAVAVSPAADPGSGFTWEGWISTAGTATVRVCNVSGASATPGAESYNVRVIQ